jgi:hypothetical protein
MMQKKVERSESSLTSEVRAAIQDLVEMGLVVDSGRRRWSERTGCFEIVWVCADHVKTLH